MAGQESILLTGATGNVGAVILDQLLLTTSHNVTAVLRKSFYIPLLEKKYPEQVANKRLTFTVIPDMAIAGAFDAAAASITAIIHVATPIATGDWEEKMIKPTWDIDRNILETAKNSNSVNRVVICGTILQAMGFADLARSDLVVSESTWNTTVTLDEAKAGPFGPAYMYSKTEAEKKTWAWVQEHASSIGFDVVQLLPSSITGRSPQVTFKPDAASPGGIPQVYNALLVDKTAKAVDGYFPFVVDTDDVAHRHILSLDREKVAGNQRYLVTRAEPLGLRAVAARLRREHPELADRLPELPEDGTAVEGKLCKVDSTKSDATFGTQWRDTYDSVAQVVFDVVRWEEEHVAKL